MKKTFLTIAIAYAMAFSGVVCNYTSGHRIVFHDLTACPAATIYTASTPTNRGAIPALPVPPQHQARLDEIRENERQARLATIREIEKGDEIYQAKLKLEKEIKAAKRVVEIQELAKVRDSLVIQADQSLAKGKNIRSR